MLRTIISAGLTAFCSVSAYQCFKQSYDEYQQYWNHTQQSRNDLNYGFLYSTLTLINLATFFSSLR